MASQKTYPIRIRATIGEDRRLVIDLPPETPTGDVEVVIQPESPALPVQTTPSASTITRDEARAKMLAAGILATWIYAPEDTNPLTPEERMRIGQLAPGSRPSEALIDEDRGEY